MTVVARGHRCRGKVDAGASLREPRHVLDVLAVVDDETKCVGCRGAQE